ncbi:cupin domain-containing protein [Haloarcula sp. S1CR25-12]|uniref:Cupin domain-containing protein n=1 Tax=Haloarcula saliterrae TaxID=2950534 RepID=A0ABU2FBC5_9EURY|nr:cupin domain-containing protein [Haloarcula sp. S1CR25-12]MDS0259010.1 cupin domain-containing protein [Haloarcula sp. S1CR25-12]
MTPRTNTPEQSPPAVELYQFEGTEVWMDDDEHARLKGYFPLSPGAPNGTDAGATDCAIVCLEIQPGEYLPTHRDSAEELLLVTAGTVEASVGEESVRLPTGSCTVVPEMAPHSVRNVGDEPARVIGYFPSSEMTATFERPLQPFGTTVVAVGGDGEDTEEM